MKAILLCGIFYLPLISQTDITQSTAQQFEQLNWLLGKWQRQNARSGRTAFESWSFVSENEFVGMGITLSGIDTVFVEKLKILIKDNQIFYMADLRENAEPTYFKMTSIGTNEFICENPEHDFPKRISYKLSGDILTAQISGDGKSIDFIFKKMMSR